MTATIADRTVTLAHGAADGVQVVATLGPAGRRALLSADAKANYPELSDWLTRLLAPSDDWTGAAERFWAALEPLPGAPQALLVAELDSGEQRRFGGEGRAYEIARAGRGPDRAARGAAGADRRGVRAPDLHPRLVPGDLGARRGGVRRADGPAPMPDRDLADLLAANEISSVRLQATNHDGLVLGKYLSTPKFVSIAERGTMLADTTFGVDFGGDVALGWDWGSWRGEVADIRAVPDVATLTRDPALPQLAIGDLRLRPPRRRAAARLPARDAEAGDRRAERPWPEAMVAPEIEFSVFEQSIQRRALAATGTSPPSEGRAGSPT